MRGVIFFLERDMDQFIDAFGHIDFVVVQFLEQVLERTKLGLGGVEFGDHCMAAPFVYKPDEFEHMHPLLVRVFIQEL